MKFQDKSHWATAWLSDVVNIYVSSVDKHIVEGETIVPVCNYTDVYYNDIITSKIAKNFRLGSVTDIEKQKFSLYQGDVIITKDSETANDIGIPTYIAEDIPNLVCGYHLSILRAKQTLDSKYLSFALQTSKSKYTFYRYANGITRFGLTQDTYENIPIILPPLEEQKEIAHILSTQDKVIYTLEQLIQAKEKRFLGLIQTLISAPAKAGQWAMVELGDIFDILKGQGLSKDQINSDGKYPCILYGELYTYYLQVAINIKSCVNNNQIGVLSKKHDILIPSSTTTVGLDLATATALQKDNVLLGGDINILRSKSNNIVSDFYAYYFTYTIKNKIAKYTQGSTIIHLYMKHCTKILSPIPPLEEQERIAHILSIAQSEISKLKELKSKHQQQKLALMQEIFG